MSPSVQASGDTGPHRLRIVSLNVWGLPWPISRDLEPRMRAIGAALADQRADVAMFQEVWSEQADRVLIESGRAAGLVHRWDVQRESDGSGLLVLSREALGGTRFEPFVTRGLPERVWHGDYWGGKGLARAILPTRFGPVEIVDTHLHAQYDALRFPEYATHRMGQAIQTAHTLSRVEHPVIAAGDFNMRPDSPEYRVLTGLTGLRDAAAERGAALPTSLASNPYSDAESVDSRIDYVFVRNGAKRRIRVRHVERIFDAKLEFDGRPAAYSDHAGLLVDLEVAPGSTTAAHVPSGSSVELARTTLDRGTELAMHRRGGERRSAVFSAGIAAAGIGAGRSTRLTRRQVLKRALLGAGGLAAGATLGLGALSEVAIDREIRDYQSVSEWLDELSGLRSPERVG